MNKTQSKKNNPSNNLELNRRDEKNRSFNQWIENSAGLPNGEYEGYVYISFGRVTDTVNPNRGLKRYIIDFSIKDEEHKGEIVKLNRVLLPSYLSVKPPDSEPDKLSRWIAAEKIYLEQTNEILAGCGVNTSETDASLFVDRIAQSNRSRPLIKFYLIDDSIVISNLVGWENPEELDKELDSPPDGEDAPFPSDFPAKN